MLIENALSYVVTIRYLFPQVVGALLQLLLPPSLLLLALLSKLPLDLDVLLALLARDVRVDHCFLRSLGLQARLLGLLDCSFGAEQRELERMLLDFLELVNDLLRQLHLRGCLCDPHHIVLLGQLSSLRLLRACNPGGL